MRLFAAFCLLLKNCFNILIFLDSCESLSKDSMESRKFFYTEALEAEFYYSFIVSITM